MAKEQLTKAQRGFKSDYFFGIGTGLLATAVSQALGNLWWVTFFGDVFLYL